MNDRADDWYIAHQTAGRTRLRFRSDPDARDRLLRFAEAVAALEGVERVTPRPTTGSLIIEHPGHSWEAIGSQLEGRGLTPGERPQTTRSRPLVPVTRLVGDLDRLIRDGTQGRADLRALLFLLLMAMAVVQLFRGQVAGPAMALFWYAYSMLRAENGEPSSPEGNSAE
jgi:hypothetical protein